MELGGKNEHEKSSYEVKENELLESNSSVDHVDAKRMKVMGSLLYKAAIHKKIPAAISDVDDDEDEDDDDDDDEDNDEDEDDDDGEDDDDDDDDNDDDEDEDDDEDDDDDEGDDNEDGDDDDDDGDEDDDDDDEDGDDDDDDDEDGDDDEDERRKWKAKEEYYRRKTRSKNNILHLSVEFENFKFAKKSARRFPQLICEVNADENNSLHIAAQTGDVDFVKLLVGLYKENIKDEQSPPWLKRNKEGNTPLHVAIVYGKIKLARYLVNLDPGLACVLNHSNESPLHLAIRHRVDNDAEVVGHVLKSITWDARKASYKAWRYSKLEKYSLPLLKLLLRKEPSIGCRRDNKGLTPPLLAATLNPSYVQAIYVTVKRCPDSSELCDRFGNNILHLITKLSFKDKTNAEVIVRLLSCPPTSALKNKQNNEGNTPAHTAILNHNVEWIAALILFSANLAIKNQQGISAADLIQQSSHQFQTLIKDKIKEIEDDLRTHGLELPDKYEGDVSVDKIKQMGLSIRRIKKSKMLNKKTEIGNILYTLLSELDWNSMGDNEARNLIKEILEKEPALVCQINHKGRTILHLIAMERPSLFDGEFGQMIVNCYYRVIDGKEGVEGFYNDPPWKVKDDDGNTILHLALKYNVPASSWLGEITRFDRSFFISEANKKGRLPLHILVKNFSNQLYPEADLVSLRETNALDVCLLDLVKEWEVINKADKYGLTPLLMAARGKDQRCFSMLLPKDYCRERGGDSDCDLKLTYEDDSDGNTIWHHIANIEDPDDIDILDMDEHICSHVSNALAQINKNGKTAFHVAIENGYFKVARMFVGVLKDDWSREWISSYLVADFDGNVPMHKVVGRSTLPYAREFIECVTPSMEFINVHDKDGMTPLHLAVFKNDIDFLKTIFDIKRDDKAITRQILQITDIDHNTLLHYATSQGEVELVDIFLDGGIRAECIDEMLDMSDKDGNSPFHLAVCKGNSLLATKFIGIGNKNKFIQAMLDKKNNEGNTALHLSILKRNQDIVDILMKTAKENNYIKEILEKCNNEGNTPLHLAVKNRDFILAKHFIEYAIEDSCINKILNIQNGLNETPPSLIGSAEHLPNKFEKFFWNEPKVVEAMLGVRSLSGVPTKMIKEYTNTIGVIAALLATITFTAGFTVPGGLNGSSGTPLLMQQASFQVFIMSDIIAMCLSMMALFFLMWIMTINDEKHQVLLLDLTVFSLQGAFFATILTFMTGLYASVFPSSHWIAIFACVLCSLLILLMHKRLIIWFIPGFIHIYLRYRNAKKWCRHIVCCLCNKNKNNGEPSGNSSHANEPTGHSQTVVNIEPNN